MKISVPLEKSKTESRVSLVPNVVASLVKSGHEISLVDKAGEKAGYPNESYVTAGASIISPKDIATSDLVTYISKPQIFDQFREHQIVLSVFGTRSNPQIMSKINKSKIPALDMELLPRISRAQGMDALSSQASIAGYKAAISVANELGIYLPMMMTAAGTVRPAKILVLGAGVAGLQAIATCRRLGAMVSGFDVRTSAGEQIESLGAKFIHPDTINDAENRSGYAREQSDDEQTVQRTFLSDFTTNSDGVITTAAIPGKPAPLLITEEMIKKMSPGSVIMDLAGESGGNVEVSDPGNIVISNGVKIICPKNLPSSMPKVASDLYAKNVMRLLELITDKNGDISIDLNDEIIDSICVAHKGQPRHTEKG